MSTLYLTARDEPAIPAAGPVSVVVHGADLGHWNDLVATLRSIAAQDLRPDHTFVVAEQSNQALADAVRVGFPEVAVVGDEDVGYVGDSAVGIGQVVHLDAGLAASPSWLRETLEISTAATAVPEPSAGESGAVTITLADTPASGAVTQVPPPRSGTRWSKRRIALLLVPVSVGLSVLMQGIAVTCSRSGRTGPALAMYFTALMLPFVVVTLCLVRSDLSGRTRRWAVVVLGVTPTVLYRLTDPLLLTGFDEQLHLRTLTDLRSGAPLFAANPLLATSPSYPGLELLTVLTERATGLPPILAVTLVVLVCRLALVAAIYRLAVSVAGDERSGSLAVVFYAVSPQFYFFNSQFAYQTLALSLAVGGIVLLRRSARAALRRHRAPLAASAALCFAAVVVTHHLTSFLVTAALIVWAAAARPDNRRPVAAVAASTLVAVVAWTVPISHRLQGYFEPVFADAANQVGGLVGGGTRGTFFAEQVGDPTPAWQRAALVGYATLCVVAAVGCGAVLLQRALRDRRATHLILATLCLLYPLTFVVRLAPKATEISDRATTFLFLPLAMGLVVVIGVTAKGTRHRGNLAQQVPKLYVWSALCLSAVGYLGGLLMGSGPDWARLPGSYLVVAENRSLDSQTLAAVAWSREHLEPGSTIIADRMPATVLASEARLWVDVNPRPGVEPATLYFSEAWGPEQTATAGAMKLRYIYVDSRLATSLPRVPYYFYPGETEGPRRLTSAALDKFARVPGIETVYRAGPVAIYDLRGLGVPVTHRGYTGNAHPMVTFDFIAGLLIGLTLGGNLIAVRRRVRRVVRLLGSAGAICVTLAVMVLASGLATAIGYRPGWVFFAAAAGPPVLLALAVMVRWRPTRIRRVPVDSWLTGALSVVLTGVGVYLAIRSAWAADVTEVARILTSVS